MHRGRAEGGIRESRSKKMLRTKSLASKRTEKKNGGSRKVKGIGPKGGEGVKNRISTLPNTLFTLKRESHRKAGNISVQVGEGGGKRKR